MIARVFLDKSLAIFDYDPDYLLRQTPTNIAFDDLQAFYEKIRASVSGALCRFHMRRRVVKLERSAGGQVRLTVEAAPATWRAGSDQRGGVYPVAGGGVRCGVEHAAATLAEAARADEAATRTATSAARMVHEYDEVILACPANVARELLSDDASFMEGRVLGAVQYFDDLTITHTDEEYMQKHNEVDGRAIYFIKSDPVYPECLEMGFELTAYQPTLADRRACPEQPRIYQSIFLDRQRADLWTIDQIKKESIIDRAWWSAFSHTSEHFRRVVPLVWTIQGHKHTWYAGSWTLFNTHDIAIASGLAAAHRLGAPYPFGHNPTATATFDTVLGASHLRVRSLWSWLRSLIG